ncbi:molecular chaperone DnaJ [Candidatus Dojkabacteria bacterium]|nr:molecular chaperone DnaJ [Candidatus Dojkabacteria bacterium]
MAKRDYYEVLGVNKSATKAEIKKKYRQLAKEYHPDRNKETGAEEKFKEVKEAYEVLSDDQKRSAYDQYGHAGTQGFGAGGNGGFGGAQGFGGFENMGDLNEIFEQFFGGGFSGFSGFGGFHDGSSGRDSRQTSIRGADLQVNLKISFEHAVFGTEKTITYKRKIICDKCAGKGAEKEEDIETCKTCKGSGQVVRVQRTFIGNIQTASRCPECQGQGKTIKKECSKCNGDGRIEQEEDFSLKIPPGIPDGVTLRFRDRGNAGKGGGNYGDLYVGIEVESSEEFERRGNDIYSEVTINPAQATLGDTIDIETVHGSTKIKIKSGTQPGKIIKLTDKGGPKFQGKGNGDHYLKVNVKIPERLNRKQKKLWGELQKTL